MRYNDYFNALVLKINFCLPKDKKILFNANAGEEGRGRSSIHSNRLNLINSDPLEHWATYTRARRSIPVTYHTSNRIYSI